MEGELGQRNQVMQQMKADLQNNEARIEHMKKATAVKEQHFKESETSLVSCYFLS
ncbi:unnamed protein product [Anisakis simplex]|uniref:Uncharacterized protein n=1 Tax=Anisakis simplex TaxID=6269 RepID=A0A0M3JGU2_ANISI|nr:unnamed protein product [Anisakis simplex]